MVNEAAGTVSRSYTFTQAGVYMVTLTVNNSCGQQGTANLVSGQTAMVVIYDPSAGFVTGGGWITGHAYQTSGTPASGAPVIVRFIQAVAQRFGVQVSEKAAAQALPAIGAVGGATVNALFMDHFQDMAHGHFTVRRLERKYGETFVRQEYERLK